jgi:hypothetical protein
MCAQPLMLGSGCFQNKVHCETSTALLEDFPAESFSGHAERGIHKPSSVRKETVVAELEKIFCNSKAPVHCPHGGTTCNQREEKNSHGRKAF